MRRVASLAILVGLPVVAFAQNVGQPRDVQTPSLPTTQPAPLAAPEYRLPTIPEPEKKDASIAAGQVFVKDIQVEGVTVFTKEAVEKLVAPYENRTVSTSDLQTLRVALTQLYIDNGFVSSGVLLPDQQVKDGVVVYRAIEGSLTDVELVGKSHVRKGYVAGRVKRHVDTPLSVTDLQYALRYLQQDPNIQRLDARLAPGDRLGESILRLAIEDQPRFSAGLSADNHRSSSTGAEHGNLLLSSRNLTGYGEEFRGSYGLSEGADDASAMLSVPVMARNTSLQLFYSKSNASIIEESFAVLEIESESEQRGLRLAIPIVEELDTKFSTTLGFEANSSSTELLGQPFSFSPGAQDGESKTSVGSLAFDWLMRGENSVTALRVAYRHGFDALGATIFEPTSEIEKLFNPTGADGRFSAFQAQTTFVQRLNGIPGLRGLQDRAQMVFRTAAQISQDPLLSLEKFTVGGVNTVRGYPENLLVRDNGVAATLEFQLPVIGFHPEPHPLNLALVVFADYGRSWDKVDTDPTSKVRNTDEARFIMSSGLGLVWHPLSGFDAQVYWGADIGNNFEGDDPRDTRDPDLQDDGVHFSISYVGRW